MDCREARLLVHAHVDGELDPRSSLEVERHLEGCAPCTSERDNHRALSRVLRAAPLPQAPSRLAERLAASLPDGAPRPPRFTGWRPVALAGWCTALALALFAFRPAQRAGEDFVAREVVAGHVRSLLPGHLADVTSTDRHTVKPWFAGKLDFAPPVEDLATDGYPLAGGRLDVLDGRTVAALVYRRRAHVLNVFVWPAPAAPDEPVRASALNGLHAAHWVQQQMQVWAVSDLNAAELAEFATLLRTRTGSAAH